MNKVYNIRSNKEESKEYFIFYACKKRRKEHSHVGHVWSLPAHIPALDFQQLTGFIANASLSLTYIFFYNS